MALIQCADCNHMVSDLAFECPKCARPIAAMESIDEWRAAISSERRRREKRAKEGTGLDGVGGAQSARPPPDPNAPLPPSVIAWREQLHAARPGLKKCSRCGEDVSLDSFRLKIGKGYICSACQDDDFDKSVRARTRRQQLLFYGRLLLVVLAIGGGVAYAGYMAANVPAKPHHR